MSTSEDLKAIQKRELDYWVEKLLNSNASKRMIVSGPGTGKTRILGELLRRKVNGCNLAMTFIKKLVDDMERGFGQCSEVKTFHAYCKKILHERQGKVELCSYLTKIIKDDAEMLGHDLRDFEYKFQTLDENATEIDFYLRRGDYYDAVSFNDSVFRLYKMLQSDPNILPTFDQIVIDEFQDFNPLEVAFIEELEAHGPILIVGDDDQAIYDDRSASPEYLRSKYNSGEYEIFQLSFCRRCTDAIVKATNAIVEKATRLKHLQGRIPRKYECHLESKGNDSAKYPKIVVCQLKVASTIPKYLQSEISQIPQDDIAESFVEPDPYPTVLIVGQRQYRDAIYNKFKASNSYQNLSYARGKSNEYGLVEAYKYLLSSGDSNLGWRILLDYLRDTKQKREVLITTEEDPSTRIIDLLPSSFVEAHRKAVEVIKKIVDGETLSLDLEMQLKSVVGDEYDMIIQTFTPKEAQELQEPDRSQPSILLTSFKGCKGLSAGHVFIVGANNKEIPHDINNIKDIEISQFIVALTRAKKKCHIIANKRFRAKDKKGNWTKEKLPSVFISWIPQELIEDRGCLGAKDIC